MADVKYKNDVPSPAVSLGDTQAASYLHALNDIIHSVMAERSLAETAHSILHHLAPLIAYDRADVLRYDFDADEIIFLASKPDDPLSLVVDGRLPLSFVDYLPVDEAPEIRHYPDLNIFDVTSPWQRMIYAEGIRCYLLVPLYQHGTLLGAISLGAEQADAFTSQQIEIMREVAQLLATRIHQVVLQQQLQDHAITLETHVQRRTAELQMVNEQLQRANRMKDQFLAAMSHELRTPLNGLLAKAEMLQEEVYGALNQRQARAAEVISDNGRHLLCLINDILDLSRLEAGATELTMQRIAVSQLCRASIIAVRPAAVAKSIALEWELEEGITWMQGDEQRLKQVLVNLLDNAVKFTPNEGEVGLVITSSEAQIHFTVWDTGIGIGDAQLERLFQPFVQLDASLARKYGGAGLGLYLVRRLVELHQGHIRVESEPEQGSRFTISLPWTPPADGEPVKKTSELNPTAPMRQRRPINLLLAADNETIIERILTYLGKRGYQLTVVRSHRALRRQIRDREQKVDVILIDADMLGVEGPEAVRTVRAAPQVDGVPVLVQSTLTLPGDRERCLSAGADGYVAQPVAMRTLRSHIEELLG